MVTVRRGRLWRDDDDNVASSTHACTRSAARASAPNAIPFDRIKQRFHPILTAQSSGLIMVLASVSTGCGDMERAAYLADSGQAISRSDLESRPSLDEVIAGYHELLAGIQSVVTSVLPYAEAIKISNGEEGECSAKESMDTWNCPVADTNRGWFTDRESPKPEGAAYSHHQVMLNELSCSHVFKIPCQA